MKLSVVIPAYNEEKRLAGTVKTTIDYFNSKNISFEIIVVDDGSTDRTGEILEQLKQSYKELRIFRIPRNQGKGFAVQKGVLNADGDLILLTDADLSTPIQEWERLFLALENGADIAVGSRRTEGALLISRQPFLREKIGLLFGLITRTIIPTGVMDTQCGFKLFKAEVAKKLFSLQKAKGFAFDLEILGLAKKTGLVIKEVGVKWEDMPGSKVHPFRHLLPVAIEVLGIRMRLFRRKSLEG